MKTINVTFTDEEHKLIMKRKNEMTYHDFIMQIEVVRTAQGEYLEEMGGEL